MQNERNRKTFEEITEQINRDNTISVNRPIAHAVGAYAAIVFNALIGKYIYYKQKNMLDRDGWFYSTIKDMKESTTLSRYHQDNAIEALIEAQLIEYCVKGTPARRYFRVTKNREILEKVIRKGEDRMLELRRKAQEEENAKQVCEPFTNLN